MDGSVDDSRGLAGAGGVLRDSMGNWVGGFSSRLGLTAWAQNGLGLMCSITFS